MRAVSSAVIIVVVLLLGSRESLAANGVVHGRLMFYQNQGNYCPTTRDCTHAQYTESQYNVNNPVAHVKVYIQNEDNSTYIGQGTTDASGYYTVSWSTPWWQLQPPSSASIHWRAEHKDNRFKINTPSGGHWTLWSTPFTPVLGTTTGSPQERGTLIWGSSGGPNQVANAYDGAWRTWYYAFRYSNRMLNNFTNLDVRAFSSTTPSTCPSSCASGPNNRVQLDANAAYRFQSRIAHEMGHIASYKSNAFRACVAYCFGGQSSPCGWSTASQENLCASFEEGLATFLGSVAIYWHQNEEPHYCVSNSACSDGSFALEESSAMTNNCATGENRWALTVMRYLWDDFDWRDENAFFVIENIEEPYFEFFDALAAFPDGTADHDDDEPWNSSRSALDSLDGRSAEDFSFHFQSVTGTDDQASIVVNCSP